jgi:hypothetical protein
VLWSRTGTVGVVLALPSGSFRLADYSSSRHRGLLARSALHDSPCSLVFGSGSPASSSFFSSPLSRQRFSVAWLVSTHPHQSRQGFVHWRKRWRGGLVSRGLRHDETRGGPPLPWRERPAALSSLICRRLVALVARHVPLSILRFPWPCLCLSLFSLSHCALATFAAWHIMERAGP